MRVVYGASAFGVVLCILWFLTTYRSQVYYRYWIKQVRAVEEKMDSDAQIFADLHQAHQGVEIKIGKEQFSFRPIERFASISRISRLVAIAFTIIWIVLVVAFSA